MKSLGRIVHDIEEYDAISLEQMHTSCIFSVIHVMLDWHIVRALQETLRNETTQ